MSVPLRTWRVIVRREQAEPVTRVVADVLCDRLDHRFIVASARSVVRCRARQSQNAAHPTHARSVFLLHRQTKLHALGLAQSFFVITSFSARCSRARSAYIFFSREHSLSSSLSRRSCEMPVPAYFCFHL